MKMGVDLREKYGDPDYYKKLGRTGGLKGDKRKAVQTMYDRYGEGYFKTISKMGLRKRWHA
jgi:hypothetical protein